MALPQSAPESPKTSEFSPEEERLLAPFFTNLERQVFALKNLPEVVKGALFSRYSRTEKSLRRVLLEEFITQPEFGFQGLVQDELQPGPVATKKAEEFYERVLVGYGDDSVAELAGAHLAVESISTLAAKQIEDSRIGLSPLEKSTRYVRFDRPGPDGRYLYHRGPELQHPAYERACDLLFGTFGDLFTPVLEEIRARFPLDAGETERAWKSATRAKALDILRGLLPAGTLTNLGVYGNGRAFEYLITKLSASELPECRRLANDMHQELSQVIPSFVRRAIDEKYGRPAALRMERSHEQLRLLAPGDDPEPAESSVRLVEHEPEEVAERRVVAAALFGHAELPLDVLGEGEPEGRGRVLDAILGERANRRQRVPRALEHTSYTFEIVANFATFRDLQRHRMLTQERQLLGTSLGYDCPPELEPLNLNGRYQAAMHAAAEAHAELKASLGPELAQYVVPLAYRVRWYFRMTLREVVHLCELRTTPQGHPDYRYVAQEIFRRVKEVHPRLAGYARFVDLGPGDELERRASERRMDEKLRALAGSS